MDKNFQTQLQALAKKLAPETLADYEECLEHIKNSGAGSYDEMLLLVSGVDKEYVVRISACKLLKWLEASGATETLVKVAIDDTERFEVREAALDAVAHLGSPEAVEPLLKLVNEDFDPDIRLLAAHHLGMIGDERAFETLLNHLTNEREHTSVRVGSIEAVAKARFRQAVPALINLLGEPSAYIRFKVVYALGQLGDPNAIPALEAVLNDDEELPGWWTVGEEAADAIELLREIEANTVDGE